AREDQQRQLVLHGHMEALHLQVGAELELPRQLGRPVGMREHPPGEVGVAPLAVLQVAVATALDEIETELGECLFDGHRRSIPRSRSMFGTSSGSTSFVSRNAPRISRARTGVVSRRLIATTLASFHFRAPRAVS